MANSFRVENYRSPKALSMTVITLLLVQVVCFVFYVVLAVVEIAKPDMVLNTDEGDLSIPILLIGLISIVEVLARLATMIVFLIWLHRVYSNLSPLRANNLEFTPGWAVGWWFIPFANLLKPYQVVREAWEESNPDYDVELGYASKDDTPWYLPLWWGFFLLGNVFSQIVDKAVEGDKLSDAFPYLLILSATFTGVAALTAFLLVRDTTRRQNLRNDRLVRATQMLQPPPPPSFGYSV